MTPKWIIDLTDAQLATLLADRQIDRALRAELTIELIYRDAH